ncbi:MAG: glutamine--fructose-6-phosphate aminotransferase [Bacteroidetes bacterium RIFCSPLOWO2_02_FULL_36_8]|nr:MAG: glutamine--fructose-6-phosphate aminotransferase [Bacteroidetes bacterium RIFCSPLOWO2_02_FULL_36_8]OFY70441.1 MAG: glutamine--fructose-6-phosphate aminotransferase [Bacteroidetes bacterium RIFCSPLOWO2_12_FULL_37_12]
MCGIVGYIGKKQAYPILINGLKRLEYRGYDSAGIALLDGDLKSYKKSGKVKDLEHYLKKKDLNGTMGMGHTRWATHGAPNDVNAHPHLSETKDLAIIHNGIIENYYTLKEGLLQRGYKFLSNTDTEVLIHLIQDIKQNEKVGIDEAVRIALNEVIGAYAIVVLSKDDPDVLIAAKTASPLVVGVGKDEYFISSDVTPFVEYTKKVIYLNDGEMVIIKKGKLIIKTIKNLIKTPYIQKLEVDLERLEKGGYEHFMLKEIYEQPRSIMDSMRGRFNTSENRLVLGGLNEMEHRLKNLRRIIFVACGTSWHASLIGERLIEDFARIPVEVEYASEFRYRNPIIGADDMVIAISQSGETADTLAAVELAKSKGANVFGICNVVGSAIARTCHAGAYTHAGPEIGVASTKAFTAQLTVLALVALSLAEKRGTLGKRDFKRLLIALEQIPSLVEKCLASNDEIKKIAKRFKDSKNFLYLGRGYQFPVALEGALKLKEISYIHAEGYPAAEMKHGPIALIDEHMPVVVIAANKSTYEKVVSNTEEVKARKGIIIAVTKEDDTTMRNLADYTLEVPETEEVFSPMLSIIPLQLLAYHIAILRGCNVDQPRNLAKSVTVE